MTPQQLKNSILQLAIQGKLVEQRPEEGTAKELLQEISEEKGRLIREGKIKKTKPLPEISEDEIPFEVPESWEWVRLPDVSEGGLGKTLNKAKDEGIEKPYLCSINVYWNGINLDKVKTALFDEESQKKYRLKKGDLLICEGGDAGRSSIWENENEMYYQNALHRIRFYGNIAPRYFLYCLELFKSQGVIEFHCKGVTIKHLVQSSLNEILFPLPPLVEQHRIVAKIEELLPYIDQYDKAYTKLNEWNEKFPEAIKKSILQYAMEGKLVEQRPEEGTAEELLREIRAEKERLIKEGKIKKTKPLPEISEAEIPFEVPESWMWVRLGDILSSLTDGTHKTPKYTVSGIPFISVKNISSRFLSFENTKFISAKEHEELIKRCHPEKGDILLSKVGTTGIPVIIASEQEFSIFVSIALLKFSSHMYAPYLLRAIESPNVQEQCKTHTRGVGNKNWVLNDIANTILPLPPLAEQKRIVTRIEELLSHCNAL